MSTMHKFDPQDGNRMTKSEFDVVCAKFQALGDMLSDDQLLNLADLYHEMLRQRRSIRARHPLDGGKTRRETAMFLQGW